MSAMSDNVFLGLFLGYPFKYGRIFVYSSLGHDLLLTQGPLPLLILSHFSHLGDILSPSLHFPSGCMTFSALAWSSVVALKSLA